MKGHLEGKGEVLKKEKQDTKKRGQNQGINRVEGTRSLLVSEGDVGIFMRYLRKSGIIPTLTARQHCYNIFATFHHHYTQGVKKIFIKLLSHSQFFSIYYMNLLLTIITPWYKGFSAVDPFIFKVE